MRHVKYIAFSNCRIRDSSIFPFRELSSTESLAFSHVRLDSLNEKAFFKCSSLVELYFNDSSITHIRKFAFQHIPLLKNLSLSTLNLENIEGMAFVGLTNLIFLNLSNNSIKQINDLTFTNMIRLRVLDMSNNYIVFIFQSSFNQISLVHVDHINQCCHVKHTCRLNHPIKYSKRCGSLLFSTSVGIILFLHVGLSVILNSGFLIFRIRVKQYNTHVLFFFFLCIIQIISVNHHITLITKHAMHKDQFPLISFQWTSHFMCRTIRFVNDFIETLSNSIILIISMNIIRLTKFALEKMPYSLNNIISFMFRSFIFSILVASLDFKFWEYLSPFCSYKLNLSTYGS